MTSSGARLLGILILGFLLRLAGVQFGLPYLYHADEPIVVNHALAYGSGDLNPHFFKIPPLISYLLFICYGIFYLTGKVTGLFSGVSEFETLFYTDPSAFYLIARIVFGVLTGTACVYALYRVIEKYYSQKLALVSAFLLSVCFLHVRDSHYIYADIPLNLVMIISFGFFFALQQKPSMKLHLISGALIGLAAAVKYNGAALAIPYLAACFLSGKRVSFKGWIAAASVSAAVFIALNPFAALDAAAFISDLKGQAAAQGGTPWFHHLSYSLTEGMGFAMLAVGLIGLAQSNFKGGARDKILIAFALGYYGILIAAAQPYDRYVLPLIPVLVFFAAQFIVKFCDSRPNSVPTLLICLLSITIFPLTKSVAFARIMSAPDVRTQALDWFEKNVPAGSSVAMEWEFYMPRLLFSRQQLLEKKSEMDGNPGEFSTAQKRRLDFLLSLNKAGYNLYFLVDDPSQSRFLFGRPVIPYDLGSLKEKKIQYVIRLGLPEKPELSNFYLGLSQTGKSMISFSPYRDPSRKLPYDSWTLTGGPFLWEELRNRERNGLPLEIYRLEP